MQLYKVYFIVSRLIRFFESFEIAQGTSGKWEKKSNRDNNTTENALM